MCIIQQCSLLKFIKTTFLEKLPSSQNAVVNITLHKRINDQILDYPFVIFSQL